MRRVQVKQQWDSARGCCFDLVWPLFALECERKKGMIKIGGEGGDGVQLRSWRMQWWVIGVGPFGL